MTDEEQLINLKGFVNEVMEGWFLAESSGGELQELALKYGILVSKINTVPCGETCFCSVFYTESEFSAGVACCHKADWL